MSFSVQDKDFNTKTCPNVPSVLVDTTLARMEKSFKNFFRGLKSGNKIGFPRFQSIKRWSSFRFRDYTMGKLTEIDNKWYWKLFKTTAIKVDLQKTHFHLIYPICLLLHHNQPTSTM